jgi:hypothetical protein
MIDKNIVLIGVALVYRNQKDSLEWFISKKQDSEEWELPKVLVRKGDSSVRATLRLMGEKGAMNVRVLEEVGRAGGSATVNGKSVSQRYLYYLQVLKSSSEEAIGFSEYLWGDYSKVVKKLSSKREQAMLKSAVKMVKEIKKENRKKKKEAEKTAKLTEQS